MFYAVARLQTPTGHLIELNSITYAPKETAYVDVVKCSVIESPLLCCVLNLEAESLKIEETKLHSKLHRRHGQESSSTSISSLISENLTDGWRTSVRLHDRMGMFCLLLAIKELPSGSRRIF
jgi:hypothetical protein